MHSWIGLFARRAHASRHNALNRLEKVGHVQTRYRNGPSCHMFGLSGPCGALCPVGINRLPAPKHDALWGAGDGFAHGQAPIAGVVDPRRRHRSALLRLDVATELAATSAPTSGWAAAGSQRRRAKPTNSLGAAAPSLPLTASATRAQGGPRSIDRGRLTWAPLVAASASPMPSTIATKSWATPLCLT